MSAIIISGQLIDLWQKRIYPANITIKNGKITAIDEAATVPDQYILPGFVDAHIHIESSMLLPTAFAQLAVTHGTVATVSDPHEIANVCGIAGVEYMIANSKKTNFKIFFGAPSCVPATLFETAGAHLDADAVAALLAKDDIWYLSEMMNYPGVLHQQPEVIDKIKAAKLARKPVDGHAPGLKGDLAKQYAAAGITTDHECFTLEEAQDKIAAGMKIIIREGSAAKNFEALHTLISSHPDKVMFCSDDKHPDELLLHHINNPVKRALAKGHDLYNVLRAASVNPVLHYGLPVGLLREADPADFIVIDSPAKMNILQTYINGELVAEGRSSKLPIVEDEPINNFNTEPIAAASLQLLATEGKSNIKVIEALDGQLITNPLIEPARITGGYLAADTERDNLKIVILNRYEKGNAPAVAFVKGFGLQKGAIASTVAHDCHNIIAVGVDDDSIATAINELIHYKGGVSVYDGEQSTVLPLPVAGLMSLEDGRQVGELYAAIDKQAKQLGSKLHAPFMTLSFMGLLVIPSLKLSDKGLFDGQKFEFSEVQL